MTKDCVDIKKNSIKPVDLVDDDTSSVFPRIFMLILARLGFVRVKECFAGVEIGPRMVRALCWG